MASAPVELGVDHVVVADSCATTVTRRLPFVAAAGLGWL
jgi:hypothetical protein